MTEHTSSGWKLVTSSLDQILQRKDFVPPNKLIEDVDFQRTERVPKGLINGQ